MGLIANLPVGLAPGLGVNAYVSSVYIDRPQTTRFTNSFEDSWLTRLSDSTAPAR